eukprot:14218556-Alexandrium_andersonii.AAC.1
MRRPELLHPRGLRVGLNLPARHRTADGGCWSTGAGELWRCAAASGDRTERRAQAQWICTLMPA